MLLPRPVLTTKKELEPQDINRLLVKDFEPALAKAHVLACPWKSYAPTSTKACRTCPFFYGFGPIKPEQAMDANNFRVFCAYPISREAFRIEV